MVEWVSYALKKETLLDARYRIRGILGIGGFGITYEAINEKIGRKVAVKELFIRGCVTRNPIFGENVVFENEKEKELFTEAKKRFLKEARTVKDFSAESGVVHVLDYFEENETAYLVMEYLDGISLEQYFREKGQMDAKTLFQLLWPLMKTLDKIHKRGIIHRDISPDNIRISTNENGIFQAELIDFGSARDYIIQKTHTVEVKNGYAPLEQYSRDGLQGPWTDIYALCAVIYEGMTGQRPINAVLRSMQDSLSMPSALGIVYGSGQKKIEKILKKGLALYPKDRYQSIQKMQEDLSELIFPPKKEEKKNRKKVQIAVVVILILLLLCTGSWWYYQSHLFWFRFHGEPTEMFLLIPPKNIDIKSYKQSVQTIKKRLDDTVGESEYLLKKKKDSLELILPLSVFPGENLKEERENLMNRYILAPNHLQISMDKANWQDDDTPQNIMKKASLKRSDIKKIEKKTGRIEGLETTDDAYLEITLTEESGQRLKEQLQKDYKKANRYMELNPDLEYGGQSLGYLYTDPDGDWTTLYQSLAEETYENGWQAIWNTEELEKGFSFQAEIPAEWEEKSIVWGEYQQRVSELSDDTVTISWQTLNGSEEEAGNLAEEMINVKDSLDLLDIPYAFGMVPDKSGDLVIRTAQKDRDLFLENLFNTVDSDLEVQYSQKGQKVTSDEKEEYKKDQPDSEKEKPYLEKIKAIREGVTFVSETDRYGKLLNVNLGMDLQKGYSKEAAEEIGQILDLFYEMPEEYRALRIWLNPMQSTQRAYFTKEQDGSEKVCSLNYFRTDFEDEKQQNLKNVLTDPSFLQKYHIGEVKSYVSWGTQTLVDRQ